MTEVLSVHDLSVSYRGRAARSAPTVSGVSFAVARAGTVGIVGESGSGKSTTARAVVGLLDSRGEIRVNGELLERRRPARLRRRIQMVFQDSTSSLNPLMRCDRAIMEVLPKSYATSAARRQRAHELLHQVRLPEHLFPAKPSRLSGGQRQRVAIARAIASEPDVLVADEATSALDVSVQAAILLLFRRLQQETGIGMVFISHDLAVVRSLCDQVLVMREGVVVEQGPVEEVYLRPSHPYTRELIAATPRIRPRGDLAKRRPGDARWVRPEGDAPPR